MKHSNTNTIPEHVAIIMDGNRRWAKEQGKPVYGGHQYVADHLLEHLVDHAAARGIKYITFWAWSTENWQRDKKEVMVIMQIFKSLLSKHMKKLHEKNVKFETIGDLSKFPKNIQDGIAQGKELTKNNTKITAIFALNYGGRDEILRAVNSLKGRSEITEEQFSNLLDTRNFPDPELIIRTGGEQRMSGFLLWQSEYSEFYFTSTMMPDFNPEKLDEALEEFSKRKRRFGK